MSILHILHLVGSAENEFYGDLSCLYGKDCIEATANPSHYRFSIAYVTPDRLWRFPASLRKEDINTATPLSLSQAIQWITEQNIDLVLPQMFCVAGMTHYRALFDLLNIPYLGNTAELMGLTANKAQAKAIVCSMGVKVPYGELLRQGETPNLRPPIVIKPANSDNSLGVTLVKTMEEYDAGLEKAFQYADQVLVEEYIELGREVRCGTIVKDGELISLPLEEYAVNKENNPIRNYEDKLKKDDAGELTYAAKDKKKAWIVDSNDPVTRWVQEIAKQCHQALGCRHYSLFDFRIDPQGQPWFLEAGLYCSFSPKSVIPMMAEAKGISLDELLEIVIKEAIN
ncbi:MAG: D-alanine--D-alanine ligase [Crocosphaera sp.]|nr:D-alanine--D-alanine ligase [Crocosphaera sp.]